MPKGTVVAALLKAAGVEAVDDRVPVAQRRADVGVSAMVTATAGWVGGTAQGAWGAVGQMRPANAAV